MSTQHKEFARIAERVSGYMPGDPEIAKILQEYTAEYLRSFPNEIVIDTLGRPVAVFNSHLSYRLHSTRGPAFLNTYCLFGARVSQADWFQLLGYTREEQIIHLLQHGAG